VQQDDESVLTTRAHRGEGMGEHSSTEDGQQSMTNCTDVKQKDAEHVTVDSQSSKSLSNVAQRTADTPSSLD
jgi:hypothetical protein